MAHDISNTSAQSALKSKLISALNSAQMLMDVLPLWNDGFAPFKAELKKFKITWLSEQDIDELIYLIYLNLPGRTKASDGPLPQSMSAQLIELLASTIIDQLASPRDYWFYFPLPQITIDQEVVLSDSIALIPNVNEDQIGLFGPVAAPAGGSLLKVQGKGYVYGGRTQSAFKDAMTKVKWTLQIANLMGCVMQLRKPSLARKLGIIGAEQQEIHYAKWASSTPLPYEPGNVKLSVAFSRYLTELDLKPGPWTSEAADHLKRHVGYMLNAIQDTNAESNIGSIRRSLEWAFDASVDEDEHMSFIKICIGLEAAIAEQTEGIGITEQLADRCAFLLEKTPVARAEMRELMRKIYKLRSKLVHGVAAGLSGDELSLAQQAGTVLRSVLATELNAFMSWYATLKAEKLK